MDEKLTLNELELLTDIREAGPYARITITKDKDGQLDCYYMEVTQKKHLTRKGVEPMR